jgi:hypothetical protein
MRKACQLTPPLTQESKNSSTVMLRSLFKIDGGPKGARTLDLHNAIVALSQLSYGPSLWK